MKNVVNNFAKISDCLNNDLYAAASLKPAFNSILSRKSTLEAMICVLELIEKPLVKLQVIRLYYHKLIQQLGPTKLRQSIRLFRFGVTWKAIEWSQKRLEFVTRTRCSCFIDFAGTWIQTERNSKNGCVCSWNCTWSCFEQATSGNLQFN
jgi:hypothetical protein